MSPSRTTACSTSAAAFSGPTPPLKTAVAGRAAAIAARTSSGSSASRPKNDPAWTKSAPHIRVSPAKTAGATPTGRSRIHRAAPTRCANRGTPSSAWRSIRNASSPCAKTLSISAVAPSFTARSARWSSESTGPVMLGAYSVPSGRTAATARTRSSRGHQSGFASSSSSFTSAAPPPANIAAVSATCSGDNPSDGLMIAPTETPGRAGNAGPGSSPSGISSATSRHRANAARSAHSPATRPDTSIVTSAPQFSTGNSSHASPSSSETLGRTNCGPSGSPVDATSASASTASGGSISKETLIIGQACRVRILLVSQMYPGPDDPDLGVFIQAVEHELERRGHELERAVVDHRSGGKARYVRLGRDALTTARRFRPDVVYAHFLVPTGLLAALASRAPLVVTAHGRDVRNIGVYPGVRMATRWVVRRVGGPPEFVPPEAGALVDPTDVDDIARGLRAAAALPCPNEAARRAAEEHDLRRQADRIQAILERAARGRQAGARRAA